MQEQITNVLVSFQGNRSELIPMLQAMQKELGYLSEEGMAAIARHTGITESQVYGVATFYTQFYFAPRGKHEIKVCCGTACHVRGGTRILETLESQLKVKCGETTSDQNFSLERVACVGSCALAPVVMVDDDVYGRLESKKVRGVIDKYAPEV